MKPNQGEQLLGSPPAAPDRIWVHIDSANWCGREEQREEGDIEYVRADLARAPAREDEDPHPGYDCGGTCVIHNPVLAARAPAPPEEQDAARKAAEEIAKTFWEDQR